MSRVLLPVESLAHSTPSGPVLNTQSGSIYHDRDNPQIRWYLPIYSLADDPDPFFSFTASQNGVDSLGDPANQGKLTLSLKKTMPGDAVVFQHANPGLLLQEVLLHITSVTLKTTFKDAATGVPQQSSFTASLATSPAGGLLLTFNNILGSSVVILYENLVTGGGAQLVLSASADMFVQVPATPSASAPVGPVIHTGPPFRFTPRVMVRTQPVPVNHGVISVTRELR